MRDTLKCHAEATRALDLVRTPRQRSLFPTRRGYTDLRAELPVKDRQASTQPRSTQPPLATRCISPFVAPSFARADSAAFEPRLH